MKYCENCGMQLADDAMFCEECGTKQEVLENIAEKPMSEKAKQPNNNNEAKKPARNWLWAIILTICSPICLIPLMFELFWELPDFLFLVLCAVIQIIVLFKMWTQCTWKTWLKVTITVLYILLNIL